MLDFMDYVQHAFYNATNWNHEHSYSHLTATARALLDFQTPRGFQIKLSSLASPNYATSYSLGSVGSVDGSIAYLFTSPSLQAATQSGKIPLPDIIQGYRQIQELHVPQDSWEWERWQGGKRIDYRDTLLYGRVYLPQNTLEALYLRRTSPRSQIKLSAVIDRRLRNEGTILALHQYDVGKYNLESLYSTDGGVFGFRGLYNFKGPRKAKIEPKMDDRIYGRFSAGAELYYGSLNKSGGVSVGGRFATLPTHKGVPLTATLTLNPLMGSISTTYAVKADKNLALCSMFDFNFYSYESSLVLGFELWRMKAELERQRERSMEAKLAWKLDDDHDKPIKEPEQIAGVLKARIDQDLKIGVLWEGRIKDLLFTLGSSIDIKRKDQPFRAIGLELQYSS